MASFPVTSSTTSLLTTLTSLLTTLRRVCATVRRYAAFTLRPTSPPSTATSQLRLPADGGRGASVSPSCWRMPRLTASTRACCSMTRSSTPWSTAIGASTSSTEPPRRRRSDVDSVSVARIRATVNINVIDQFITTSLGDRSAVLLARRTFRCLFFAPASYTSFIRIFASCLRRVYRPVGNVAGDANLVYIRARLLAAAAATDAEVMDHQSMRVNHRSFFAILRSPQPLWPRHLHVYFWFQTERMTHIRHIPSRSSKCTNTHARTLASAWYLYAYMYGVVVKKRTRCRPAEVWYATRRAECPFHDGSTRIPRGCSRVGGSDARLWSD